MVRTILRITIATVALAAVMPLQTLVSAQSQNSAQQTAVLNLNTATQTELEKLPGVGPATAKQIIEYRQKNNGFKKVEELMNIKGIGEKSFLKLKSLVTVAPPKTTER